MPGNTTHPHVIILGGPNGAGKSTAARGLLRDLLGLADFVNADTIASGLSGYAPERVAFAAGRIMLSRLHELAAERADFAFETTMSSRTFAPWLAGLRSSGYMIHIVFMWLRSPELALRRVRRRVREGGHDVPEGVIRRRYTRGARNFVRLYLPLADSWRVYDNSATANPQLVAFGGFNLPTIVNRAAAWRRLLQESNRAANHSQDTTDI
ncbi:MAG: AAA family ATPase [Phycisphaerae bacterium]|nr:AAA family ATPase [Phycisphaerae bacterium]